MQRIVVGVDSSDGARRALAWAVEEAGFRHATVEAVHAWQLPYFVSTPLGNVPLDTGDHEVNAQAEFDEIIDGIDASRLSAPIARTFVAGSAAGALIEAATGADLLVVGNRGRGGFAGLRLGSVSQQLAHHAPCPVVIVPNDGSSDS